MGESVRKVNHYSMLVPDKPGAAFNVLATLVSAGINLLGCSGSPKGKKAQIDVVPDDTRKFVAAAKKAQLTFVENRSGYLLMGEGDRPGVLASKLKILADQKINVTRNRVVHGGTAATIGNVDERDARLLRQQDHGEMPDAAAANRCVSDRMRLLARRLQQFGDSLVGPRRIAADHIGRGRNQ